MKKTILTTLAIAITSVGAAQAEIGETSAQFETGLPVSVNSYRKGNMTLAAKVWAGKTVVHAGMFDDNLCVEEIFTYVDGRNMNKADFNKFLAPYAAKYRSGDMCEGDITQELFMSNSLGQEIVVSYSHATHKLKVMTLDYWSATDGKGTEYANIYNKYDGKSRSTVEAAPTPEPGYVLNRQSPSTPTNDCLIIATETYGHLKPNVSWVRIASGRWTVNGGNKTGHAIVFFQLTPTSDVFFYDASFGSVSLGTKSHDLTELTAIMNNSRFRSGDSICSVNIEDPQWRSE